MFALVAARAHAFYRGTRSSSCRKPRLRALRGLFTTLEEREMFICPDKVGTWFSTWTASLVAEINQNLQLIYFPDGRCLSLWFIRVKRKYY